MAGVSTVRRGLDRHLGGRAAPDLALVATVAFLATVALAASAVPAGADWQYTQWGMTPDQVKAASDGAATDNADRLRDVDGLKAALVAPYQGETVAFTAVFLFNEQDRLRYVTLNPIGKLSCPQVVQTLADHYGAPGNRADMVRASTMRWNDLGADNLVVYLDLGGGDCSVQYSKLPPTRPDGKGL